MRRVIRVKDYYLIEYNVTVMYDSVLLIWINVRGYYYVFEFEGYLIIKYLTWKSLRDELVVNGASRL